MGTQGQIEVLAKGRRTRRYRTPRAVLRALELASASYVENFTEEQILEWINAAAPLAARELINEVRNSEDEEIRHKAAVKILEWSAGKPKAAKADAEDPRSKALFNIVVPEKAESFEDWIRKVNATVPAEAEMEDGD